MTVKFLKITTVDFEIVQTNEIGEKTFFHNEVVNDVSVEELSSNYSNLHFTNGVALNVPNNTFKKIC